MIASFKDKRTETFAEGGLVKAFEAFAVAAERRLAMLDVAASLDELRGIKGNRLEALKGDRQGQYSIRINRQWRICFVWNESEACAEQVEIADYH
jgi:proteic killer suppression protein